MVQSFTLGPDRTKISLVRSGPSPTVRSGQSTHNWALRPSAIRIFIIMGLQSDLAKCTYVDNSAG